MFARQPDQHLFCHVPRAPEGAGEAGLALVARSPPLPEGGLWGERVWAPTNRALFIRVPGLSWQQCGHRHGNRVG